MEPGGWSQSEIVVDPLRRRRHLRLGIASPVRRFRTLARRLRRWFQPRRQAAFVRPLFVPVTEAPVSVPGDGQQTRRSESSPACVPAPKSG